MQLVKRGYKYGATLLVYTDGSAGDVSGRQRVSAAKVKPVAEGVISGAYQEKKKLDPCKFGSCRMHGNG